MSVDDILDALDLHQVTEHRAARAVLPADATEAQILQVVSSQPLHVDDIRMKAGLPIEKVSATLALMELKGMVRQVGGMHYVAVREAQEEYNAGESGE